MGRYKKVTLHAYEKYARDYAEGTADYFEKVPEARAVTGAFLALVGGKRILDCGCGPGRDSAHFAQLGYKPLGVDISSQMLALAASKGLNVVRMDFEHLGFADEVFDGVWAFHSLMHAPKYKLPLVLCDIFRILKPGSPLLASFMEGKGNEWRKTKRFEGCVRYFAHYQESELRHLFEAAGFYVIGALRPEPHWLNMLMVRPRAGQVTNG